MRTATLSAIASIGLPTGPYASWFRDIVAAVLRQNSRTGVEFVPCGRASDLAVDMDGLGLPAHQGKVVRLCLDGETGLPDPGRWYFSPSSIVWRGASVRHGLLVAVQKGRAFVLSPLRSLGLPEGMVNVVLAAVATCLALDIEPSGIRDGFMAWRQDFSRLRRRGERLGVSAWDDSAGRSGTELLQALRAFDRKVTLVTGGPDFQPSFDPEMVRAYANRVFLLPGTPEATARIWETLAQAEMTASAREALHLGLERTAAGGELLVSPGCAAREDLYSLLMEELAK